MCQRIAGTLSAEGQWRAPAGGVKHCLEPLTAAHIRAFGEQRNHLHSEEATVRCTESMTVLQVARLYAENITRFGGRCSELPNSKSQQQWICSIMVAQYDLLLVLI